LNRCRFDIPHAAALALSFRFPRFFALISYPYSKPAYRPSTSGDRVVFRVTARAYTGRTRRSMVADPQARGRGPSSSYRDAAPDLPTKTAGGSPCRPENCDDVRRGSALVQHLLVRIDQRPAPLSVPSSLIGKWFTIIHVCFVRRTSIKPPLSAHPARHRSAHDPCGSRTDADVFYPVLTKKKKRRSQKLVAHDHEARSGLISSLKNWSERVDLQIGPVISS